MRAVEEGLKTCTIGLGLKVLLANRLGGLWNEAGTVGYESISTPFAWPVSYTHLDVYKRQGGFHVDVAPDRRGVPGTLWL